MKSHLKPCLFLIILLSWPVVAVGQGDLLSGIERLLNTGREREALQTLGTLRQIGDASLVTPRFLFLEAKAMLATGFPDEARAQLESIRDMPVWERQIDETEMLAVELSILKSLGQPADALKLVENQLPPLDELDPPYPPTVTQLHLVYCDLLLACLRNHEAVQTLFDLLKNGDPKQKSSIARSLLTAADQRGLSESQWEQLPAVLKETEGMSLWTDFARSAFDAEKPDISKKIILTGIETNPALLRVQWPSFLDQSPEPSFREMVSGWILSNTAEIAPALRKDWLAIKAATLEKSGRVDEAIQTIRDNLWGDVDLQIRVAGMLAARGDIEGASRIYSELDTVSPGRFLEPWGSLFADLGMTEKALAIWARIPATEKRPEVGYLQWGRLLKSKGFLPEAAEAFKKGLSQTTQPVVFSQELLDVSISLGDVPGALSTYQIQRNQNKRAGGLWSPERLVDQLRRTQQMDPFLRNLEQVLDATSTLTAAWRDLAVEMATELALQMGDLQVLERWLDQPPRAVAAYWDKDPKRKANHLIGIGTDLSLQGENMLACRFLTATDRAELMARPNAIEAAARAHTAVGDATPAIELWRALHDQPKLAIDKQAIAGLAIARLYLDNHQAGKAIEALSKLPGLDRNPPLQANLQFCQAMAYTQLHEKSKALPLLEEIYNGGGEHSSEAQFWLAEWSLWQRDWEDAKRGFEDVLSSDPGQALANEALWRLRYMKGLSEEQLPGFSLACFFEGSGEWKEAEENYRKLASALTDTDLTDWIYYRIGRILIDSGRKEEGLNQWRLLQEKSQNPTLALRIRFETAEVEGVAAPSTYQDLVLGNPNTLLGDLAREKIPVEPPIGTHSKPPEMVP
jgi:tetratricopeptide (TPR) repeat protein